MPVPDAGTVAPPAGPTGPVSPDAPGPLQLERAWHGLMWTMGGQTGSEVTRAKTVNSVARNLRHLQRNR